MKGVLRERVLRGFLGKSMRLREDRHHCNNDKRRYDRIKEDQYTIQELTKQRDTFKTRLMEAQTEQLREAPTPQGSRGSPNSRKLDASSRNNEAGYKSYTLDYYKRI